MQSLSRHLLRTSAVALLLAAGSLAAGAVPAPASPGLGSVDPTVIKHLPAGRDELVFRGEASERNFPVYLSRGEVETTRTFQLTFQNTVAALPDRSAATLAVNGHLLATVPLRSSNGLTTVAVPIPAGVLVPGLNAVDVNVAMSHRVDCSVAATYELWTLLDPARTGFVAPAASAGAVRSLDELAGEPLAQNGTTRIHLRLPDPSDTDAVQQAGRFIDALVARAGLNRPVVDVGADPGQGAGFDVILANTAKSSDAIKALRVLGREDGVTLARDPASGRLTLIMTALDDADLDTQVSAFAAAADRTSSAAATGPTLIDGETRRSFADLGQGSDNFAGRHYAKSIEIALPGDFYPANYDKARLLIDGAYAADLEPDSNLVFRVNGTLVSSLRLGPDRGGVLQHEIVELPLRFFHPGTNVIGIEGTTRTLADRQCDTAAASSGIRLTLADTSELEFPQFAHLGTTPQLPGAMASLRRTGPGSSLNVYLADADPASVGAGLTVLANMASTGRGMPAPSVRIGSPSGLDAPGIVVAPLEALPANLAAPVRARMAAVVDDPAKTAELAVASKPDRHPAAVGPWAQFPQGRFDSQALVDHGRRLLRNQGFFFGADGAPKTVPFAAGSLLIAAVDPRLDTGKVAGIEVPRFTRDSAQWLVVTASSDASLQGGLTRLVSDGQWKDLRGEAVSLDVDKGRLAAVQPSRVLYVVPDRVVMADLRPILGGIVSNNIELSLAVLMVLMGILGVSTHALIRRAGAK